MVVICCAFATPQAIVPENQSVALNIRVKGGLVTCAAVIFIMNTGDSDTKTELCELCADLGQSHWTNSNFMTNEEFFKITSRNNNKLFHGLFCCIKRKYLH